MTEVRFIYVTVPSMAVGETIARAVIDQRLAACVNLIPGVRSIYRWQGSVEAGDEVVALFKTTAAQVAEAMAAIVAHHPYETPVVAVLPIEAGSHGFLAWIAREIGSPSTN